jgi:hypothetical protein
MVCQLWGGISDLRRLNLADRGILTQIGVCANASVVVAAQEGEVPQLPIW